jgi:riboflavin kinase/FMN adenylyltransferase
VRKASALLGRNHVIEGKVVEGARRGRDLGFPTANLEVADALLVPSSGVYVVRVNRADVTHGGMMNIGHRPTFNGTDPTVEVHLFDFEGDLYGQMLRVELLERLRDEQRFSSVEDLVAQLTRDRADALATLARAT